MKKFAALALLIALVPAAATTAAANGEAGEGGSQHPCLPDGDLAGEPLSAPEV